MFYAGESLAAGFHASVQANSYRPLMNTALRMSGEVEEIRATKPADAPFFQIGNIEAIPESGVDLAIIELGTNDAGRTELPVFRQQYNDVLTRLKAGSPDVHIICAGAWGFPGKKTTVPYDKVINTVCEEHAGRYVGLTATVMTPEAYGRRPPYAPPSRMCIR